MFLVVVFAVKVWCWKLRKVKVERDSWESQSKPLYKLREMRERVFVWTMVFK